ncbi:MAG: hypothetical protein H0V12_13125 [Chloroflexi bacterium]|nr:hypothetical protein [Chloroflexota bacterium]
MAAWWAGKIRQFGAHVGARVMADERQRLEAVLSPAQMRLFDEMHRADQRHGLDVVASLRAAGHREPDLLLAGIFHDAGKGRSVAVWHRVAWSLGERYGTWVWSVSAHLPTFGPALERTRRHAEESARLALAAGCSPRTADLIRHQAAPQDRRLGEALRLADQAN